MLIAGIALIFLSGYFYSFWQDRQGLSDVEVQQQITSLEEYDAFIASVREEEKSSRPDYPKYPKTQ